MAAGLLPARGDPDIARTVIIQHEFAVMQFA
jgi:hypothetical protein